MRRIAITTVSPVLSILLSAVSAFAAAPTITSLSTTSTYVGYAVTITGTNFGSSQGSSTVTFNGTTAAPVSWKSDGTSIGVRVPAAATTGNVVVTVAGVDSNGILFTVKPQLTALSTTSGPVSTSVTLTGTGFGPTATGNSVMFKTTAATPVSWSITSIVVTVPLGATTGLVAVTVAGARTNGKVFTVTPAITGLSLSSGPVQMGLMITGTTLGTKGSVTLNGVTMTPVSWSAPAGVTCPTNYSCVTVQVPAGATNGNIVVTSSGASATNGLPFTVSSPFGCT